MNRSSPTKPRQTAALAIKPWVAAWRAFLEEGERDTLGGLLLAAARKAQHDEERRFLDELLAAVEQGHDFTRLTRLLAEAPQGALKTGGFTRWALARLRLARDDLAGVGVALAQAAVSPEDPWRAEWLLLGAMTARAQGELEPAQAAFRAALEAPELSFPGLAYYGLGECLLGLGRPAEAQSAWSALLSLPDEPFLQALARLRRHDLNAGGPQSAGDVLPLSQAGAQQAWLSRLLRAYESGGLIPEAQHEAARQLLATLSAEAAQSHRLGVLSTRFSGALVAELGQQERALSLGQHRGRLLIDHIQRRRRHLTCLTLRLHGFTAHFKALDPEDQLGFLNDFLARVKCLLFHHNGALEQVRPTTLCAIFGALDPPDDPQAARHSALDALNAALAIEADTIAFFKHIKRLFFELPVERIRLAKGGFELRERTLGLGVGLASGYCQSGVLPVADANGRLLIGHAVNLAERLVRLGRPREILLAQSTYALLAGLPARPCEFEELTSQVEYEGGLRVQQLKDYENIAFYRAITRGPQPATDP